jgi:hypothetical protein
MFIYIHVLYYYHYLSIPFLVEYLVSKGIIYPVVTVNVVLKIYTTSCEVNIWVIHCQISGKKTYFSANYLFSFKYMYRFEKKNLFQRGNNARNSLKGFYTTTGTRRLEHYVFIPIPIQPSAHIWFLLNPDANHMKFIHKIKLKRPNYILLFFSGFLYICIYIYKVHKDELSCSNCLLLLQYSNLSIL